MKTNPNQGQALFQTLLDAFNQDWQTVIDLFTDDAFIEYPYAHTIGVPARLNKDNYRAHLQNILPQMPGIAFSNVRVYPLQQPYTYWAEVHGETTMPATGNLYRQDYVMFFTIAGNQFSRYREYWNPVAFLQASGQDTLTTPLLKS
ncbi:nuclear transport factor 2 family protein [Spirosoma sp. 209]|uniref:nuclear transport factor 2 family protein n=1 Tax=Spirosoma sp. 209 TaxID=1955701 RepID=UPI00098D184C|nr:nuclear transport factor 2 family protein [Spirosoma sp. 209]